MLLLTDAIDTWCVMALSNDKEIPWQSITESELPEELEATQDSDGEGEEDKESEASKETKEDYDGVLKDCKALLKNRVSEVKLSHRLTESPACVVKGKGDLPQAMAELLEVTGKGTPPA